jgi:hypothetical protein
MLANATTMPAQYSAAWQAADNQQANKASCTACTFSNSVRPKGPDRGALAMHKRYPSKATPGVQLCSTGQLTACCSYMFLVALRTHHSMFLMLLCAILHISTHADSK